MTRLFQAFSYTCLPPKEHEGYPHSTGKRFKSANFRIRYFEDRFEIDFTALDPLHEKELAMAVLKEGLKLGEVHFAQTSVSLVEREVPEEGGLHVRGFVCAAVKNPLTGRKIFIEPGENRHTGIVLKHSLQKFEALLGKPYEGKLIVTPKWQSPKPQTFWYENIPYVAWNARYEVEADKEMLNLLLKTGMGSDTMKNLGFLEML